MPADLRMYHDGRNEARRARAGTSDERRPVMVLQGAGYYLGG